MSNGHFGKGYWLFIKKLSDAGTVPCEENPDIFFPEDFPDKNVRDVAVAVAKRLCKSCPVKADCLSYAIESNQRYGIWAGTSPSER